MDGYLNKWINGSDCTFDKETKNTCTCSYDVGTYESISQATLPFISITSEELAYPNLSNVLSLHNIADCYIIYYNHYIIYYNTAVI